MSVGVFTSPLMLENVTHSVIPGFGGVGTGGVGGGAGFGAGLGLGSGGGSIPPGGGTGHRPALGKYCKDLHQRLIPHGVHFVPGPDECTLCLCDDGEAKWCKAVYCQPPQDCKSFRIGNSCCDFICLEDSLDNGGPNSGGPNTGGPYLSRPVEIANFVPKVVIAAVTAMLSLSLLFFLIHRLRQRHIQGRLNSARARRSTQMCDECDDTRSLDFSNDFFEHRMNSPHLYPPQYLAWWKPPSSYFPPRGEAPPPYEEAMMATTSISGNGNHATTTTTTATITIPYGNGSGNHHHHHHHNHNNLQVPNPGTNVHGGSNNNPAILNDIPIIVPPPVLPPGPQGVGIPGIGVRSSPAAIQRLASAIASTTNSGGSTTCGGIVTCSSPCTTGAGGSHGHSQIAKASAISSNSQRDHHSGKTCQVFKNKSSKLSSKTGKSSKGRRTTDGSSSSREPQPGPSRTETDSSSRNMTSPTVFISRRDSMSPRPFRISPPRHGPAPPTYEDAIYSLHPAPRSSSYFSQHRHSLTLPPRRFIDDAGLMGDPLQGGHLYPRVVVHGGSSTGLVSGGGAGPLTCYTEEELLRRAQHHQNQRYSLQFHVGEGSSSIMGGSGQSTNGNRGDWSSSSSTLSLSTAPNSPVDGRAPSLSSSSESSVSEENSPPPPAPTSSTTSNSKFE